MDSQDWPAQAQPLRRNTYPVIRLRKACRPTKCISGNGALLGSLQESNPTTIRDRKTGRANRPDINH